MSPTSSASTSTRCDELAWPTDRARFVAVHSRPVHRRGHRRPPRHPRARRPGAAKRVHRVEALDQGTLRPTPLKHGDLSDCGKVVVETVGHPEYSIVVREVGGTIEIIEVVTVEERADDLAYLLAGVRLGRITDPIRRSDDPTPTARSHGSASSEADRARRPPRRRGPTRLRDVLQITESAGPTQSLPRILPRNVLGQDGTDGTVRTAVPALSRCDVTQQHSLARRWGDS
jgi:hypothetical protein